MKWQNLIGITLIISAAGVLLSGTYLNMQIQSLGTEPTCKERAVTAVLVDRTDPFTEAQKQAFDAAMQNVVDTLDVGERLIMVPIKNAVPSHPSASLCRLPDTAHWLYENEHMVEKKYAARFGAPLAFWRQEFQTSARSSQSPIFETIKAVAEFSEFSPSAGKRRMVIVSDMLQNTTYSQYRDGFDFGRFQESDYASQVFASLDGVAVEVVYLRNDRALRFQGEDHRTFWKRWFAEAGATVELKP